MSGIAKKIKREKVQDVCGVHSGWRNVYAYLEGKLSGEEKKKFASHVGNCRRCLETIIIWHYENIMAEIESKLPDNDVENTAWGWQGRNAQANEILALFKEGNTQTKKIH